MSETTISALDNSQRQQLFDLITDAVTMGGDLALHLLPTDEEGLSRFFDRSEQFSTSIMRRVVIAARMVSAKSQAADEEVPSRFGYLKGLKQVHMGVEQLTGFRPKPIAEQLARLRELFPGLGSAAEAIAANPLPDGAEAWFAIPRWQAVAATYGEAVQRVIDLIGEHSPDRIFNYRKDKLGPEYLREYAPSAEALKRIESAQPGNDILIIPAQFGIKHRGRSHRRSRELYDANEFGLGAFASLVMLLTHPERLRDYDDLWLECPGDEYAPEADGRFIAAPLIFHYRGELEFDILDYVRAKIGSVTGFLPQ